MAPVLDNALKDIIMTLVVERWNTIKATNPKSLLEVHFQYSEHTVPNSHRELEFPKFPGVENFSSGLYLSLWTF